MKKNLYLLGAGNLGREVESWIELLPNIKEQWNLKGYLNEFVDSLQRYPSDYEILGNQFDFDFETDDYILLCQSDPKQKEITVGKLSNKVQFFTYTAPTAILGKFIHFGIGNILCPNTIITSNVTIGDFVFIEAKILNPY